MRYSVLNRFCQVLLVLLPIAIAPAESWDYDEPEKWYREYRTCRGLQQSPIDITKIKKASFPSINFGLYDESFNDTTSIEIENNGHTIVFKIPSTAKGQPYISGGPLHQSYEVDSVHFHWGKRGGSEHTINGRPSDLEMHIVHRSRDGDLAVLGILFDVAKAPNSGLDEVFNKLGKVVQYGQKAKIENFKTLGSILGDLNREGFYTYKGSLTTPPCSEIVTWIVFSDHLGIDHNVLPKFFHTRDNRNYILENNVRPVQRRNRREVLYRSSN